MKRAGTHEGMHDFQASSVNCQHLATVGKQWLLVSVCLGMKVIDIGTVSGLKRGLCKAFSMQDIKWCSVDRCLCINTSDNDAALYIEPSFNYVY